MSKVGLLGVVLPLKCIESAASTETSRYYLYNYVTNRFMLLIVCQGSHSMPGFS